MAQTSELEDIARTRLTGYIINHKMRKTPERYALLAKACTLNKHFNADDLHAAMENDAYHVSRSTVFKTLRLFADCGLLRRHVFGGEARYELMLQNHCHLICEQCGKVTDAADDELLAFVENRRFKKFNMSYCDIDIHGLCTQCARKQRRKTKKNL